MQRWKATYEYLVKESLPEVGRLSTQRFPRELSQRKDDKLNDPGGDLGDTAGPGDLGDLGSPASSE
jgi:hypothetical protein